MNFRQSIWTGIMALVFVALLACKFEGRVGYNEDDVKESQSLAEKYLTDIQNQDYNAALEFTTDRLKSSVTPESIKANVVGHLEGGTIQNWRLKSHQIIQGSPRSIHLLYEVKSSMRTYEMKITTELVSNPVRWKIASVKFLNDNVAVDNAKGADVVANQFLQHLQSEEVDAAFSLTSPLSQKNTSVKELHEYWKMLEANNGPVKSWVLNGYQDTTADLAGTRKHYTMLVYKVMASNGNGEAVLTMLKAEGGWQVEGLQLRM